MRWCQDLNLKIFEIFSLRRQGEEGSGSRESLYGSLYQLIKRLRQRIEAEAGSPRYIITVSGGYQFFPEGRPEK